MLDECNLQKILSIPHLKKNCIQIIIACDNNSTPFTSLILSSLANYTTKENNFHRIFNEVTKLLNTRQITPKSVKYYINRFFEIKKIHGLKYIIKYSLKFIKNHFYKK